MRVPLVTTRYGQRLHIAGARFYALCGIGFERVVCSQYELTDAEPNVAGLAGLCKVCRKCAEEAEREVALAEEIVNALP